MARTGYDEANVFASEINDRTGNVVLYMEYLTRDLEQALIERFGAQSTEVVLEPRPALVAQSGGRQSDDNPFYGGAEITGLQTNPSSLNGSCSTAFGWESSGTYPMLSADHCAPFGESAVATTVDSGMGEIDSDTRENWEYGYGTVRFPGQTGYYGDISLIRLKGDRVAFARMYRGGSSGSAYNTVKEIWPRAQIGQQFCTGGESSGERCGWVVQNDHRLYEYSNGDRVQYSLTSDNRTGQCTFAGDCGGSIFTVRLDGYIAAKGIISGGLDGDNDTHQGSTLNPCRVVFTNIADAVQAFPGSVKLG